MPIAYFLPRPARLLLFTVAGAGLLLAVTPGSFIIISATLVEAFVLERVLRGLPRKSMWRQYLPYVLLLNLFWTDIFARFPKLDITTLGVAFAVIRVFMTAKQLLGGKPARRRDRIASLSAGGFFLPLLAVGPVMAGTTLWAERNKPEPKLSTEQLYRHLFGGYVLAGLASPWMLSLAGGTNLDRWTAPFVMLALFTHLFFAFWGQSLIAEKGAAIAGFTVPQNFNRPWLATDVRDFWNRWHISMAKFVMQYIFLPLNLRGLAPKLATILSFVFMGLWHEVQLGYIIWGVSHGVLMAYAPTCPENANAARRWGSRAVTLSTVVTLSYVANYAF